MRNELVRSSWKLVWDLTSRSKLSAFSSRNSLTGAIEDGIVAWEMSTYIVLLMTQGRRAI